MAKTTRKPAKPPTITDDPDTVRQALDDLGINRPFYTCRAVGNRLEFSLYGGDLVYWPPAARGKTPPAEANPETKEE
jgi:hypothetical protein